MVLYVSGLRTSWANGVVGAHLSSSEADERIEWAVSEFEAAGVAASWSTSPFTTPADLPERLLAHGFEAEDDLPWMAADLAAMPWEAHGAPTSLIIEEVASPELHEAWLTAMVEGFESDEDSRDTLDRLGRHELDHGDGTWVRFAGLVDGRPVASAGLILAGGVAGVYNVATLPSMRRRGLGTDLSRAAMRHARDLGYRLAVLGTSEAGRGVYERLGFRDVYATPIFVWHPSA